MFRQSFQGAASLAGGAPASSPRSMVASLTAPEAACVARLIEQRQALVIEGAVTDVKSEVGYSACGAFLDSIDRAAQTFSLRPAARAYRSSFTANYRALFPDGNRHYRVDVLEASVDQQFDIWVNGQKFELDAEAIRRAQALQRAWFGLIAVMDVWTAGVARHDLVSALVAFDEAWAAFEHRYISALIAIEEQARQLVVEAAELERRCLANSASEPEPDSSAARAEKEFVDIIAKLNSIANHKGKGRDDLRADVLAAARAALRRRQPRGQRAAEVLAKDVLTSYDAMRVYMRKVGTCLEHVDPHLCNNVGLVARLVDYEESWEVGARYLSRPELLDAICDVFGELREAGELAPALNGMVDDCDVELFMVLPRLVVLGFLSEPTAKRAELVRSLLPHRFAPGGNAAQMKVDPELKALYGRYKETVRQLGPNPGPAKAALIRLAVCGASSAETDDVEDALSPEAAKAARELLLAVEQWSLELQRHCAENWNQCSAVLVHCLTEQEPKQMPQFQV